MKEKTQSAQSTRWSVFKFTIRPGLHLGFPRAPCRLSPRSSVVTVFVSLAVLSDSFLHFRFFAEIPHVFIHALHVFH